LLNSCRPRLEPSPNGDALAFVAQHLHGLGHWNRACFVSRCPRVGRSVDSAPARSRHRTSGTSIRRGWGFSDFQRTELPEIGFQARAGPYRVVSGRAASPWHVGKASRLPCPSRAARERIMGVSQSAGCACRSGRLACASLQPFPQRDARKIAPWRNASQWIACAALLGRTLLDLSAAGISGHFYSGCSACYA
jgi:hypothetical protein